MQTPSRLLAASVLSLAVLATSACSDSGDDQASDSSSSTSPSTSPSEAGTTEASGPACTADDIEVEGGFGEKPEITLPDDCSPPTTLLTKDLVTGSGPKAAEGGSVESNYHLVTWSDRQVLDSSFERGQTFTVAPLGQAQVIAGWNQGLVGMQKGTRRLLVVPPDLGYGEGGNGVAPNETLVFVIDAVNVS